MTRTNDIIRMAREAGIDHWWESGNEHREVLQQHLERFAALVRADEREACAKEADRWSKRDDDVGAFIGRVIRARGQV